MQPMLTILAAAVTLQEAPRRAPAAVALPQLEPLLHEMHVRLQAMQPELDALRLDLQARMPEFAVTLALQQARMPQLMAALPELQARAAAQQALLPALLDLIDPGQFPAHGAPSTPHPQDAADSIYRAARDALNGNEYRRAAELFHRIHIRHARSSYAADSYYWEAFALYRIGGTADLRQARRRLQEQQRRFPKAATRGDAETLAIRIDGELARRGDSQAAERVSERAAPRPPAAEQAPQPPQGAQPPEGPAPATPPPDEDDDIRVAALNALLQMDADQAVPILKQVLARRDKGSTTLRRKAIFLVSQKRSSETASILLQSARSDPDPEVRQQAVFWLSQVPSEEAVVALDSILRSSTDAEIQDKAIFALSQHRSERAAGALRAYAERRDVSVEIREKAIFWLSQHHSEANGAFLRGLFPRLETEALKEKVLFSLSQMRGEENSRWLLAVAGDRAQPVEIRKKALFWAGQGRAPIADLVALYDRMDDREMREQLVFVYSQRRDPQAVDKLLEIAKNDPDRELRKKALFWLGQSRDPRVAELLLQIINQPEP